MTDQPNGTATHDDAQALVVKAEHKQAMARLDFEERQAMAEMYRGLPIPLRVMFDPNLNERVKAAALIMSQAEGFTPAHLIGKTEACFVVVTKALTWRLDPQAVAASTYQTPDKKVGYEGKLIQAVIEASGRLSRPIGQGEYFGDWSKVEGRFKIVKKTNQYGKEYTVPEPSWDYWGDVEEGLGVRYKIHLIGQDRPLEFEFMLRSAFPRNATTWPTRPKQQLHYAAMRALGNVVCPSLIMGVPWADDPIDVPHEMKDVTPAATPPAPPPVNLEDEQIRAAGAPQASDAPERVQNKEPGWMIEGKTYQKPGWAAKAIIDLIDDAPDDKAPEIAKKYEAEIARLPDAQRRSVEDAIAVATASAPLPAAEEVNVGPQALDGATGATNDQYEAEIAGTMYRNSGQAADKLVELVSESRDPDATLARHEAAWSALPDDLYVKVSNARDQRAAELNAPDPRQSSLLGDDDQDVAAARL